MELLLHTHLCLRGVAWDKLTFHYVVFMVGMRIDVFAVVWLRIF